MWFSVVWTLIDNDTRIVVSKSTDHAKPMCHAMPFSARALKSIFFDVDIVVKKKSKCGLAWSVLLSTTIRVSLSIGVQTTLNHIRFVKFPQAN